MLATEKRRGSVYSGRKKYSDQIFVVRYLFEKAGKKVGFPAFVPTDRQCDEDW